MEKEIEFKITGDKDEIIAYLREKGFSNEGYVDCDSAGFAYMHINTNAKSFWPCSNAVENSCREITLSEFKELKI